MSLKANVLVTVTVILTNVQCIWRCNGILMGGHKQHLYVQKESSQVNFREQNSSLLRRCYFYRVQFTCRCHGDAFSPIKTWSTGHSTLVPTHRIMLSLSHCWNSTLQKLRFWVAYCYSKQLKVSIKFKCQSGQTHSVVSITWDGNEHAFQNGPHTKSTTHTHTHTHTHTQRQT